MSRVFQHIVEGRHTALIGRALDLDDSYLVRLVRVRCDRAEHAFAPLLEAKARIERLLGVVASAERDPHVAPAAETVAETGALARAIESAHRAKAAYLALGMPREQARVWETLGRLERLTGRPEQAANHLAAAFEKQRANADAIGLARSTAALAELATDQGDWQGALGLLAVSIGLNLEKGSTLGLAVNRDALDVLRHELGTVNDSELLARVRELETALEGSAIGESRTAPEANEQRNIQYYR